MRHKKNPTTWAEVWKQVQAVLEEHGAPKEVLDAAQPCNVYVEAYGDELEQTDDVLYLVCPEILYKWLEVPATPESKSNIRFVKPILWPWMQRHHCKTLAYKINQQ